MTSSSSTKSIISLSCENFLVVPSFSWSLEEYRDFTCSTIWLECLSWEHPLPWAKDTSGESSDNDISSDFIAQTSVEQFFRALENECCFVGFCIADDSCVLDGALDDEHWFVGFCVDDACLVGFGIDDLCVVGFGVGLEDTWWCIILSLMIKINTSKNVHFLCRHNMLLIPIGKFAKCAICWQVNYQSIEWQKGYLLLHHCLMMESNIISIQ